jgi:uncharacterized protein YoxC
MKILTLIAIVFTLNVSAQTKAPIKTDTASKKVDSLTANTKFISISDVGKALSQLEDKMTVTQAKTFDAIFQVIVQQLAKEYYTKKEQPK